MITQHSVLLEFRFFLLDREGLLIPIIVLLVRVGIGELLLVLGHPLLLLLDHLDIFIELDAHGFKPVEAVEGLVNAEDLEQEGTSQ